MINVKAVNTAKNVLTSIVSDEYDRYREGKLLFIVPETSKASVERILFDKVLSLNPSSNVVNDTVITSGLIEQDVISFIKLSERVVSSCGGDLEAKSNDLLLRNVIYKIFVLHSDEFRTISKYVKRFEYIDMIINLLGDFTRYGVDVDCLDEVLNATQTEDNFYDKIYDLKLLMKYISEANIEYGYSLLDSYLKRAVEIINKVIANKSLLEKRLYSGVKALAETNIVIYGFGTIRTLTPQENEFIDALSELGANITIYPLYDLVDSSSELYYFGDLLSPCQEAVRFLQ